MVLLAEYFLDTFKSKYFLLSIFVAQTVTKALKLTRNPISMLKKISLQIFQIIIRSKGHYCSHYRDKYLSLKDKTVMVTVMPLIFSAID